MLGPPYAAAEYKSMRYGQLFEFSPVEDAIRLQDASQKDEARRLVSSYVLSEAMAKRLTERVFPCLQPDQPAAAKALLIAGNPGTGKSHLLATISGLAEHADLADAIGNATALRIDPATATKGSAGVETLAGRFKVIRAEIGPKTDSLRDTLIGQLEEYLAAQGVSYSFPPPVNTPGNATAFGQMMAAFCGKFPEHGLLLVVDELADYLQSRTEGNLLQDLTLLRELADLCQRSRFRFIAGVSGTLFNNPRFAFPADRLGGVGQLFEQVLIGSRDVRFVVAERIARKTPAQKERVKEYLAGFARFYGSMNGRMDEFVATFPIHPDCAEVLEKISCLGKKGSLRLLSDAIKPCLDKAVPTDYPGLIAYDYYWDKLSQNREFQELPEVEAVGVVSRAVEAAIEKSFKNPEDKAVARRIVHALSVHRLTTDSIYSKTGTTAEELRDMLCLYQSGLEKKEGASANNLLSVVMAVLAEAGKTASKQGFTFDPDENQCYLLVSKFKRFARPELLLHWINAVPFVLLMLSGGIMMAARFSHMDRKLFALFVIIHKLLSLTWVVAVPLTVLLRSRFHWSHVSEMLCWNKVDLVWFVQSVRSLYSKNVNLPKVGRFNTGQKINACLVMLYFFGFGASGVVMFWKGTILFPWYVHSALFFATIATVSGHLYLAMINASTRIALPGIFNGWTPMEYVKHHHPLSLPPSLRSHLEPAAARTIMEEVFASRAELVILATTLVMAAFGAFTFGKGQLVAVKAKFAGRFADCIKPYDLSTKHRIGPPAESCTKCHLYAGEIPDSNCEKCHTDIKDRRAAGIGYHGTQKGECITCHKEHLDSLQSIIPLVKEKFDHKQAAYQLEGKHAKADCDSCHKKARAPGTPGIYYLGLKYALCTDCHRDPHNRQFAAACDKCHSANGWTGQNLRFVHDTDSSYQLAGKHKTTECAKCHKPIPPGTTLGTGVFKGLPKECAGCHNDPHQKQFAAACTACHSPSGWTKAALTFDHNRDSKYPLVGKHAEVACDKCHPPKAPGEHLGSAQFRGLRTECADCHKDPHGGKLGGACTRCHPTPATWKVSKPQFDHDRDTKYPLSGRHAFVDCIRCHKPPAAGGRLAAATFKGLATECTACHRVRHSEKFGLVCVSCHSTARWKKRNLGGSEHILKYKCEGQKLTGAHLTAKCSACHALSKISMLGQATGPDFTCSTCHKQDDPHKGVLGADCAKCHSLSGWKGQHLLFNHATMTRYPLDRDHAKVACVKCHENGQWKPVSSQCKSCHPTLYGK